MTPFNATVTDTGGGCVSLTVDHDTEGYPPIDTHVRVLAIDTKPPIVDQVLEPVTVDYGIPELNAMAIVHDAIKDLHEDAQRRVLVWAGERFGFEMKMIGP